MYQVIIESYIDGVRQTDMVCTTLYKKTGFAQRKADAYNFSDPGEHTQYHAYVRPTLMPVSEVDARTAYCRSENVYIDGRYGQVRLTPSGHYSSHAPSEILFYRSVEQWIEHTNYTGNYYIEQET